MNKLKKTPSQSLVGIQYWMEALDCSRSTVMRRIKSGTIPKPDIPAEIGGANKWFQTTPDNYMSALHKNAV